MNLDAEFSQHAPFLRALARRLASDPSQADDLVQETYVAALAGTARRQDGLLPWLAAILRKRAARSVRSSSRLRAREQSAAQPAESLDTANVASKLEVARRLLQHVESLSSDYREVVFLRFYEEQKPQQIAEQLKLPVTTVKTRLARALTQLRDRLDADDGKGRQNWMPALCAIGGIEAGQASPATVAEPAVRRAWSLHARWSAAVVTLVAVVAVWAVVPQFFASHSPPASVAVGASAVVSETPSGDAVQGDREQVQSSPRTPVRGRVEDAAIGAAAGTGQPAAHVVVRCTLRLPAAKSVPNEVSPEGAGRPSGEQTSVAIRAYGDGENASTIEATTDAFGHFEIELPKHAKLIAIEAVGSKVVEPARWRAVQFGGAPPVPLVLTRYLRGGFQGFVVRPSGEPVAGAEVQLQHDVRGERTSATSVSDGSGRFAFAEVADMSWLQAKCDGFVQVVATAPARAAHGGWQPARIIMVPAATLHVEIANSTGQPASHLGVGVMVSEAEHGLLAGVGRASGHLRIRAKVVAGHADLTVPAGLQLALFVGSDRFVGHRNGEALLAGEVGASQRPIVVESAQPDSRAELALRVVLKTDADLRCTVVDAEGKPVEGCDVQIDRLEEGAFIAVRAGETDAQGQFVHHVASPAGSHMFEVFAIGPRDAQTGERRDLRALRYVQVGGLEPARVELQLSPQQQLLGTVVDSKGRPVAAKVRSSVATAGVLDAGGHPLAVYQGERRTDEQGTFRITTCKGAVHQLEVFADQFVTVARQGVRLQDGPLAFVLERAELAHVSLRVADHNLVALEVRVGYFEPGARAVGPSAPELTNRTRWMHGAAPSMPVVEGKSSAGGRWRFDVNQMKPVDGLVEFEVRTGLASLSISGRAANQQYRSCMTTGIVTMQPGAVELPVQLARTVACRGRIVFADSSQRFDACVVLADDAGRLLNVGHGGMFGGWQMIMAASSHGHFALPAAPVGTWELRVGTREELLRGEARWRQRLVFDGSVRDPIMVRL